MDFFYVAKLTYNPKKLKHFSIRYFQAPLLAQKSKDKSN